MRKTLAVVVAGAWFLTGCATNFANFKEETFDPVSGLRTSLTKFKQKGAVTVGSKQDSATGSMQYTWGGEENQIAIANDAAGQEAGTGAEVTAGIVQGVVQGLGVKASIPLRAIEAGENVLGGLIGSGAPATPPPE